MSKTILDLDKTSLSNFQKKDLYLPNNSQELVDTRFSLEINKRAHAGHIKAKLDQIPVKEGEVIYTASKKYDSLLKVQAFINLIPVKVKEEYKKNVEICYHHNLG